MTISDRTAWRMLTVLAGLLGIFDGIGGFSEVWAEERARVWASRVRFPAALLAVSIGLGREKCSERCQAFPLLLPLVALGMVTLGGLVLALVLHGQGQGHGHEWIFAVESAFVLIMLVAIGALSHRPASAQVSNSREREQEYSTRT